MRRIPPVFRIEETHMCLVCDRETFLCRCVGLVLWLVHLDWCLIYPLDLVLVVLDLVNDVGIDILLHPLLIVHLHGLSIEDIWTMLLCMVGLLLDNLFSAELT